jgi:hypothetical protein
MKRCHVPTSFPPEDLVPILPYGMTLPSRLFEGALTQPKMDLIGYLADYLLTRSDRKGTTGMEKGPYNKPALWPQEEVRSKCFTETMLAGDMKGTKFLLKYGFRASLRAKALRTMVDAAKTDEKVNHCLGAVFADKNRGNIHVSLASQRSLVEEKALWSWIKVNLRIEGITGKAHDIALRETISDEGNWRWSGLSSLVKYVGKETK